VDDVVSALAWVHAHAAEYKVDPKRVALMGESAGAYLVDYAAMIAPKTLPLAATKRGTVSEGTTGLTGVKELNAEGLPPFLLLHGTADEQVPYEQSPRFCEALKTQGVACELYTVPGGRHGLGGGVAQADDAVGARSPTIHQ
jgi:acetyl esterase